MTEETKRAVDVCKRIGAPTGPQKQVIRSLYPSTCVPKKLPMKRKFDPKEVSIAEKQKKKAAIVKPRTTSFVLLETQMSAVPKGKARKSLLAEGRIKKVPISRVMSKEDVHECIHNAYSELQLSAPVVFLSTTTV